MDEKHKIHAFYILLILGSVIVGLVAVKWSTIPSLPELITFALTITSLVLAVLAIVYAYVSNSSSAQTTARLTDAAEDIVDSGDVVRRATEQLRVEVAGKRA